MATISVGNIKFNWKGPWSGSTTYSVDDVVSHSGNSYIAIQAGSNQNPSSATAYWQQMAQKGTDADLASISGTVQGDIYYNNGSAIARLAPGSASQVLQSGGAGANPSWGTVSSDFVKIASGNHSGTALVIDNCFTADYTHYKFYLYNACMDGDSSYLRFQLRSGGSSGTTSSASEYRFRTKMNYRNSGSAADTGEHAWNDSSFRIGWNGSPNSTKAQHVEMYLDDPYSNTIKFMATGIHGHLRDDDVAVATFAATNDTAQTTRWTGLRWYVNSGNSWTAKYAVYGMKV